MNAEIESRKSALHAKGHSIFCGEKKHQRQRWWWRQQSKHATPSCFPSPWTHINSTVYREKRRKKKKKKGRHTIAVQKYMLRKTKLMGYYGFIKIVRKFRMFCFCLWLCRVCVVLLVLLRFSSWGRWKPNHNKKSTLTCHHCHAAAYYYCLVCWFDFHRTNWVINISFTSRRITTTTAQTIFRRKLHDLPKLVADLARWTVYTVALDIVINVWIRFPQQWFFTFHISADRAVSRKFRTFHSKMANCIILTTGNTSDKVSEKSNWRRRRGVARGREREIHKNCWTLNGMDTKSDTEWRMAIVTIHRIAHMCRHTIVEWNVSIITIFFNKFVYVLRCCTHNWIIIMARVHGVKALHLPPLATTAVAAEYCSNGTKMMSLHANERYTTNKIDFLPAVDVRVRYAPDIQ